MKTKLIFMAGIFALMLSCGTKKPKTSDDIDVAKLNTACDCLDAMDLVATETLSLLDKYSSFEEMRNDSESLNKYNKLEAKLKEVTKRCTEDLKIKKEEAEKCATYNAVKTKMDQVEEKL